MIKIAIIILALAAPSLQECTVGCLRCSPSNACLLCDYASQYFKVNATCVKISLDNCLVPTATGACVTCQKGYYLDPAALKCVAVPTASSITGCTAYNSFLACVLCSSGYYLDMGTCLATAANRTVTNCLNQTQAGLCNQCAPGFMYDKFLASCVAVPSVANCVGYSFVRCDACAQGYQSDPNWFTRIFYDQTTVEKTSLFRALQPSTNQATSMMNGVCYEPIVANCANFSTVSTCSKCVDGYYLDANRCLPYPLEPIPNCQVYRSIAECARCLSGFNLVNSGCVAIATPIAGCQEYDGSSINTLCVRCNATAFVSANACTNRTASLAISNCKTVALDADACATCNDLFALTVSRLKCFPVYGGCTLFADSSTDALPVCASCPPGMYVVAFNSTAVCNYIAIDGCVQVDPSATNQCTLCGPNYALTGNKCVRHVNITNCTQYSGGQLNTCNQCSFGSHLFSVNQFCEKATMPANCTTWDVNSGCTACAVGTYLSGTACVAIPIAWGPCQSAIANADGCGRCSPGNSLYVNNGVNICVAVPDYVMTFCAVQNAALQSLVFKTDVPETIRWRNCAACTFGAVTVMTNNIEAFCVRQDQLYLYNAYAQVQGCQRYGLTRHTPARVVCMECQSGFFVSGYWNNLNYDNAITCVYGCPNDQGQNVLLLDDLFGFRGICVPVGSGLTQINEPGCGVMARFQVGGQGPNTVATSAGAYIDWRCSGASGKGYLFTFITGTNSVTGAGTVAESSARYQIQAATLTSTGLNLVASDVLPYTPADLLPTPSVFNYRAIEKWGRVLSSTTFSGTPSLYANCEIFTTTATGSMYATGTGYTQATGNVDFCLRCRMGYQLAFTVTASSGNANTPTCVDMGAACNASVRRGGLPSIIEALFSCHSCTTTTTFPTVWMDQNAFTTANNAGLLTQYSLPTIVGSSTSDPNGFRCAAAPTTVTTDNVAPTSGQQVSNCAGYAVLKAITTQNTNAGSVNSYCVACASGYYPIYPSGRTTITASPNYVPTYIVTQCVASVNCDSANTYLPFNSCGKCSTASEAATPPVYYAYSDYRLINCLPSLVQNCFLLAATGSDAGASALPCMACKAGYILNLDGICDTFKIANQPTGATFSQAYLASKIGYTTTTMPAANVQAQLVRVHYLLAFFAPPYGVSACGASYTQIAPTAYASTVCVNSSYIGANRTLPTPTGYIPNCIAYSGTYIGSVFTQTCYNCTAGLLLNDQSTGCHTAVANCVTVQASTPTLCRRCAAGYYNVNGVCINTVIENCKSYSTLTSSPSTTHTCGVCNDGYYQSSDRTACRLGSIPNCATYLVGSGTLCSACVANYVLVLLKNYVRLCYPLGGYMPTCKMTTNFDLTTSVGTGFQNSQIRCSDCVGAPGDLFRIKTVDDASGLAKSTCLALPAVPNCAQYDAANNDMFQNSLVCTQCATGFYLNPNNNQCIARKVLPAKCSAWVPNDDLCSQCQPGFFLSNNAQDCLPNPTGVYRCMTYSSATACSQCVSGYYLLANNTCNVSTVVDGCQTYSADKVCTACVSGRYLTNATYCQPATATGCLTYASLTACASCPNGYGLSTANNVTNCVVNNLNNCAVSTQVAPFACLNCTAGFYLNNGTCTAVSTVIDNCVTYDTNVTCSACDFGYVLIPNRTVCNATLFDNWVSGACLRPALLDAAICVVCDYGYSLQNGACVSFANATLAGCDVTDPTNTSACLYCKSGSHYMNNASQCVAINPPSNNTTNNTTPFTPSGVSRLASLIVALVAAWMELGF